MTPDDVEEVLVAYLGSLHRAAITRRTEDPLPFILVRHVDGREDPTAGTADHLVSVRVLCDRAFGEDAAADTCTDVHQMMMELARDLPDVFLVRRNRNASIDYVTCMQSPKWAAYENNQILSKASLFQVGLAYS